MNKVELLHQLHHDIKEQGVINGELIDDFNPSRDTCYCTIGHALRIAGYSDWELKSITRMVSACILSIFLHNEDHPEDIWSSKVVSTFTELGFTVEELLHLQNANDKASIEVLLKEIDALLQKEIKHEEAIAS